MEIQKFRIKRINPDIHWDIPCSGGTNFWPINTSTNCSGITMYNSSGLDVISAINGDILNTFPEELKHCSPTDPCVILWDTAPSSSPNHCTSSAGFLYVLFKGLNVTLSGNTYTDSFDLTRSVISVGQTSISPVNITPNTFGCQCLNPLGENLNKIPIFISQDFNDIGHYTVWDGNISQQEVFANFVLSAVTSTGFDILVSNTTDFGYYETFQKSPFTIEWGEFGNTTQILYYPSLTTQHIYTYSSSGPFTITITQDTPWGPISTSKTIQIPMESYAVMAGSPISPTNPTLQMDQTNPLVGPTGFVGTAAGGSSTGYFNSYPDMPLDSGTHINEYSGMTFGAGSASGEPCFVVSGITDSILGNFQTYTNANTVNLPPGYNAGVTVPIGGDVLDPVTSGFLTGVYGVIEFASPQYTAYTISSAANSTGTADGDTPIRFWDFNNGITIFEATSCGLDNLSWGAEECIACPSGDCEYCTTKDEYVDRVTGVPHSIGPGVVIGDWSPSGNYIIGDIVYDVTFNSCCCFMAVTNISSGDPWFGKAPITMLEGVYDDAGVLTHVWEACSPECVSCPPGTNTPCNDYSLTSFVYSQGNFYTAGDFVEGEYGNCYQALVSGTLDPPTGYTTTYTNQWDYIGCVSWICPTEGPESDCDSDCITTPPINGIWSVGQMNSGGWGWIGGAYQTSHNFYVENDTVTYNGVCYVCLWNNVGASFPCSFNAGNGEPDISSKWQSCPLPSAQSLDCIMISGATLDTFDQFGNPITITGEMFWADCDANLSGGTCFEGRWKCIDQYTCQGCIGISANDPLYFTPLSYATEQECLDFCEPPVYSCTTPTAVGVSCCDELNCSTNSTLYINTMASVNATTTPITDLAYNNSLFVSPVYNINDCNNGVSANFLNTNYTPPLNIAPNGAIDECCITTVWTWDCENGCQSTGGLPSPGPLTIGSEIPDSTLWATSADCEQNMLIYYGVANVVGDVPCSWWCEDPFLPYQSPTPGPYQSPCIPCYSLSLCPPYPLPLPGGAGPFQSEPACVTACSQTATCWTCDHNFNPPCQDSWPNPCPTLIATGPDVYGPDPTGGLNGIPSWTSFAQCDTACTDTFGWDCFLETGTTSAPVIPPVNIGCQQGMSVSTIAALGWQVSDPDPNFTGYSTYTACCYANQGCCYAKCDDVLTINNPPTPPGVDWPCQYDIASYAPGGPPNGCNDPTVGGYVYQPGLPWCYMFDCTNDLCPPVPPATLPTCCDPTDDSCDCACEPPVNSSGAWDSLWLGYQLNDAVYWGDTDTDFCCFKCYCDYLGTPYTPGDPTTYDCNHFTPGDPMHMGVPNCWRPCNLTPGPIPNPVPWMGLLYNPCSACTNTWYDPGYSCTPDGCILSGCDPGLGTGHLFNCYTSSACDDFGAPECEAQCYCPPQAGGQPCVSDCITLQQELINGTSPVPTDCPPNIYSFNSYNACMGINPVNATLPDCCPILPDQWYCDNSSDCSSNPTPVVGVDGTGCVQISSGNANYQNPITTNFTSLGDCQADCNWCCDPNGVTVCTFVGNLFNCAGTSYINALSCHLATSTNTPCDCSVVPDEFWCYYNYPNNIGGCVSNITGLADVNLFGSAGLDRATDATAFFTSAYDCEQACKFCCDCDVTGECYLNWYCQALNPGGTYGCDCHDCYDQLAQCALDQEPCVVPDPEYYCDDILGCTTYPIVNTLIVGPFTGPNALTNCQEQCQFECNDNCICEVVTIQVNPISSPPCYTLACCHLATNTNKRCCECEECLGSHMYSYEGTPGTLNTYWISISGPALQNVTSWNTTGPYTHGQIVTQDACCYIMVLQTGDWASWNTTMTPSNYYNQYMNVMNTTGLPVYGQDLMWMPCDPKCSPVVYEERWWCDDNNPSYPYQTTNCIEEYPWIDNQVSSNAAYGDHVYGHDGPGTQVSYNNNGTPFSSLAECQKHCKYCCDPTPDPPCCCCEDDGFGQCIPATNQSPLNPNALPCDQACSNLSLIECPPPDCCCCKPDYSYGNLNGCQPGTQVMYQGVPGKTCDELCRDNFEIECPGFRNDGDCKICCSSNFTGNYYSITNSGGLPCNCNPGDAQAPLSACDPIIADAKTRGRSSYEFNFTEEPKLLHTGNPAEKAKSKQAASSGPQPCCIVCQTLTGAQYQVSQASNNPPCKCSGWLHINLGPCPPPTPASGPCELDWLCATCENKCFDSYYSCMTLTNDCTPPDIPECHQCVGIKSWYTRQLLMGYWNPLTDANGQFLIYDNPVPNTFDGWDGTNVIPHSAPVVWNSTEPYWGTGQIVIDPKHPGCCWVRTQMWDHAATGVPNMPPDQYSPSEHWCNYLSGNSADGANVFNPPGGTSITAWQGQSHDNPWWVPCDSIHGQTPGISETCYNCTTGGSATLGWKCWDNSSLSIGCTQGNYAWNDPDVFSNQADCNAGCWMWLCNSNPFWGTYSKCATSMHTGTVGDAWDFMDYFINHANPNLQPISYVYTNNQPGILSWFGWPPTNPVNPCPITSGPNSAGYLFSVDSKFCVSMTTNPSPAGCQTGAVMGGGWLIGWDWQGTYTAVQTGYNTHIENCTSFADVQDVMINNNCEYTHPASIAGTPCAAFGAVAGSLANITPGSEKYNDSGLYQDLSTFPSILVYDSTKTGYASNGCGMQLWPSAHRQCPCNWGTTGCDCWKVIGTGTTGGPANLWDYTFPIDDYTGCTDACCVGTCECCEPNLTNAGYIGPTDQLTWQGLGASGWNTSPFTLTVPINTCIVYPDGQIGPGGSSSGPDLGGLWNYGSGTLSGGCCICCVAGGTGTNSDPLNDGNPTNGECFMEVTWTGGATSTAYSAGPGNTIVNLYEFTGQWVSCGVDEECDVCTPPNVVAL